MGCSGLLVACRLLLHKLLGSLSLGSFEAIHHFAIRHLSEILLARFEQLLLLLSLRLKSLS